jgi:hypothetical protein
VKEGAVKINNRQQLLVLLAVAAFALLIGDRVIFTPMTKAWKARGERIADLRKQVERGEALVTRERTVRDRWAQMRTGALPDNTSLAEQQVLKAFDTWAQDSRVSISSILPQWKQDSDDYKTLECRVEAAGDLDTLARFLYEIEKDPMALKLDAVELNARDAAGQQLTLGVQVSGLVLLSKTK